MMPTLLKQTIRLETHPVGHPSSLGRHTESTENPVLHAPWPIKKKAPNRPANMTLSASNLINQPRVVQASWVLQL
jgi:hypothetical protein